MEISGRENVAIPGPVRPDNGQKWTQRAEKHLLVQYERHLRVPGQVSAPAEGGAPMYRRQDVNHRADLRGLARNAALVVGGGEEVAAGAAGRCGVGVWRLVGWCVVAFIG